MSLWTPSAISTALWLDASDSSTLFDAVSGGSAVALDSAIARWQDKSGNGRHVTQSTGTWRPIRKGAIRNSLDVVRFDGADDFLIAASSSDWIFLHSSTNATVYTVQRIADVASPNAVYFLLATRSSGFNTGWYAAYDDRSSLSRSQVVFDVAYYGGATSVANLTANNALPGNSWAQINFINNNTAVSATDRSEIRINAGVAVKNNVDTPTINSSSPLSALRIGSGVSTGFLLGDIGEIVIRTGVDTTETRQLMEGYLAWKWGLQTSLPSDHPYRNGAPTSGAQRRVFNDGLFNRGLFNAGLTR